MSKIELQEIQSLTNEQTFLTQLNQNSVEIEDTSDSFLSRDGTTPNSMNADLDMNSNRILNLPAPLSLTEPLRFADIGDVTLTIESIVSLTFDSISGLRAFGSITVATAAFVSGWWAGTTKGGGIFKYDSTDVVTADDGGMTIVDASGRRWKRSFGPTAGVAAEWFGARFDDSNDDYGAIQAAVNYVMVQGGGSVLLGLGVGRISQAITVSATEGVFIRGQGRRGTEITLVNQTDAFVWDGGATNKIGGGLSGVIIKKDGVDHTSLKAGLRIKDMTGFVAEDIEFRGLDVDIFYDSSNRSYVTRCDSRGTSRRRTDQTGGAGPGAACFYVTRSDPTSSGGGGLHITDCEYISSVTDLTDVGANPTAPGYAKEHWIYVVSVEGIYVNNCHANGVNHHITCNPGVREHDEISSIHCVNTYFDGHTGNGLNLIGGQDVLYANTYQDIWLSNCFIRTGEYGVYLGADTGTTPAQILITGGSIARCNKSAIWAVDRTDAAQGVVIDSVILGDNNQNNASDGYIIFSGDSWEIKNCLFSLRQNDGLGVAVKARATATNSRVSNNDARSSGLNPSGTSNNPMFINLSTSSSFEDNFEPYLLSTTSGKQTLRKETLLFESVNNTPRVQWSFAMSAKQLVALKYKYRILLSDGTFANIGEKIAVYRRGSSGDAIRVGGEELIWGQDQNSAITLTSALSTNTIQITSTGSTAQDWVWYVDVEATVITIP